MSWLSGKWGDHLWAACCQSSQQTMILSHAWCTLEKGLLKLDRWKWFKGMARRQKTHGRSQRNKDRWNIPHRDYNHAMEADQRNALPSWQCLASGQFQDVATWIGSGWSTITLPTSMPASCGLSFWNQTIKSFLTLSMTGQRPRYHSAPKPLGRHVTLMHYVDANLYHNMLTRRSVTGILHLFNKTPIDWYSKKQATQ